MWSIGDIGQRPERSKKKQFKHERMTSVEWQFEQLFNSFEKFNNGEYTFSQYLSYNLTIFEQAKEMEKEQIINAVLFGMQKGLNVNKVTETDNNWVNNYYNETYKSTKE